MTPTAYGRYPKDFCHKKGEYKAEDYANLLHHYSLPLFYGNLNPKVVSLFPISIVILTKRWLLQLTCCNLIGLRGLETIRFCSYTLNKNRDLKIRYWRGSSCYCYLFDLVLWNCIPMKEETSCSVHIYHACPFPFTPVHGVVGTFEQCVAICKWEILRASHLKMQKQSICSCKYPPDINDKIRATGPHEI